MLRVNNCTIHVYNFYFNDRQQLKYTKKHLWSAKHWKLHKLYQNIYKYVLLTKQKSPQFADKPTTALKGLQMLLRTY